LRHLAFNQARPFPSVEVEHSFSSLPQKTTQYSCGKAIIVGEHAVVYGARAVAIPIPNFRMKAILTPSSQPRNFSAETHFSQIPIEVSIGGNVASPLLREMVIEACNLLQLPPFSFSIVGYPHLPLGAGLGGSASLCVVILKALSVACQRHLEVQELAFLANLLEKRFHGTPSGLDTSVVAFEQPISFVKGEPPVLIPLSPQQKWQFVLIDSGTRASTKVMIQQVAEFFQGEAGQKQVDACNELALWVEAGFRKGNLHQVANAMQQAQRILEAAGIMTSVLREMIQVAEEVGVLAAKVTGAGGGGCILALLDPTQAAWQVSHLEAVFSSKSVFSVSL
jgi:mevalonate kinase